MAPGRPRTTIRAQALRKGRLHFRLDGEKLHGRWMLTRTRGAEDKPQWLLIKRNDEDARARRGHHARAAREREARAEESGARREGASCRSSSRRSSPRSSPSRRARHAGEWVYEVKHDGYRMLARFDDGDAPRLFTRTRQRLDRASCRTSPRRSSARV